MKKIIERCEHVALVSGNKGKTVILIFYLILNFILKD